MTEEWGEPAPGKIGRWLMLAGSLSLLAAGLGASHLTDVAEAVARDTSGFLVLPLIAVNTALLYLVVALPLLAESFRRRPSPWRILAFLLLVPALTILPPLYPKLFPEFAFASEFSGDIRDYVRTPARNVRLETASIECAGICQILLLSGMSTVTVATQADARTYVMASDDRCALPGDLTAPISMYARAALLSGRCFPSTAAAGTAPDATISIVDVVTPAPQNLAADLATPFGSVSHKHVLTVTEHAGAVSTTRTRETAIEASRPSFPLTVGFTACEPACAGRPALVRESVSLGAFDDEMAVLDAFRLTKPDLSTDRTYSDIVEGMLDSSGDAVLTRVQHSILDDWTRIEHKDPARRDAILLRLIEDQRVVRFDSLGRLIALDGFLERNIRTLVGQMTARGAGSNFSKVMGELLGHRDLSLVRPFAAQIIPVIEASDWSTPVPLARHAGRLGLDTSALISRRLADPDTVDFAITVSCLADAGVGEALVPALLDVLSDVHAIKDSRIAEIAVRALSRFGHLSDAKSLYMDRIDLVGGRVVADVDPWSIDDLDAYCRPAD